MLGGYAGFGSPVEKTGDTMDRKVMGEEKGMRAESKAEKFPEGFEVAIGPPSGSFGAMTRNLRF